MIFINAENLNNQDQIIRLALVISSQTFDDIRIYNLTRGLEYQELIDIKWYKNFTGRNVIGNTKGSHEIVITHEPLEDSRGVYDVIVSKPNEFVSISSTIQLVLPMISRQDKVWITGATDSPNNPSLFFINKVLEPIIREILGYTFRKKIIKESFNKFDGKITIRGLKKIEFHDIFLTEQGVLETIDIYIWQSNFNAPINQLAEKTKNLFSTKYPNVKITCYSYHFNRSPNQDYNYGTTVVARTSTGCILSASEYGTSITTVDYMSKKVFTNLSHVINIGATIDEQMSTYIIILALIKGINITYTVPKSDNIHNLVRIADQIKPNSIIINHTEDDLDIITI